MRVARDVTQCTTTTTSLICIRSSLFLEPSCCQLSTMDRNKKSLRNPLPGRSGYLPGNAGPLVTVENNAQINNCLVEL
jgi:hypothetical protein